ncbi:MAG TPA: GNAT family N-acetyltransferase [bacterium]|nr:GNAT family N-acetyltransferase [bacterium]
MKIYFRELTIDDIPDIKAISKNIWDGEDYIPQVIEKWLQDKNCMNYGAFMDENLDEIVGFGRVKLYNDKLAWLEGGRVNVKYQNQGIGREMTNFAINYACKVKANVAQFDTSSKNQGSNALAKFFGFKKKKSMNVLNAERKDIKQFKPISLDVKKVMVKEAKELYKHFNIGPGGINL